MKTVISNQSDIFCQNRQRPSLLSLFSKVILPLFQVGDIATTFSHNNCFFFSLDAVAVTESGGSE